MDASLHAPDPAVTARMRLRPAAGPLLALTAGALAYLALRAAGAIASTDDALGAMGFDPDRSSLITALVVEGLVVASAVLPRGRTWGAPVAGAGAFVLTFRRTFLGETSAALAASGAAGRFDPLGWAISALTLAVVVGLVGMATMLLVDAARGSLLVALGDLRAFLRRSPARGGLRRPVAVLGAALLVATLVPVFGDMVNYGPDVRMVANGASQVGLTARAPGLVAAAIPSVPPLPQSVLDQPGLLSAGGSARAVSSQRPWLAWRPSGSGLVSQFTLPGPWLGGARTATVFVYTPPGYGTAGRRYPVLYEVPWGTSGYETYDHITSTLDGLITSGSIPPELVVFVSEHGGPYPDSECMNTADGREWFERYVVSTVVPYVDGHYSTIATPAARALLGFSQGGYCAPMLLLRHPDTFSSAIVFSGYFQAAIRSGQTPNAWRPYGGDQALIASTSPLALVPKLPAAVRSTLFVELSASPTSSFYGPQYDAFAAALHAAGVPVALFPTPLGHAWSAVRLQLPQMLETLAAREVATGVFRT